jgi:nucleoside 2-deoxyribosyltransferase
MKVYISSSNFYKAHGLEMILRKRIKGIQFTSAWHIPKADSNPETRLKEEQKPERAENNLADIEDCDVLVMMDDFDNVPGGKHFELGAAFILKKRCIVLGRREHGYTRHEDVTNATGLQELIGILRHLNKN